MEEESEVDQSTSETNLFSVGNEKQVNKSHRSDETSSVESSSEATMNLAETKQDNRMEYLVCVDQISPLSNVR